jgi:membrane protease YdiL (CAAX protease family)
MWLGFTALLLGVVTGVVAAQDGPYAVLPFLTGLGAPDSPAKVILLLSTFGGLFIGAMVAAAALHFRGPGTLFGPWAEWRRGFLVALAVLVPVYGLPTALSIGFGEVTPNLDPSRWALLLPLALPFLFVQIAAEELFFRGYLQQQLAVRFASRIVWMGLPSAVFCLLHWNPAAGANLPLVLLATFTFGLVAADLTERTGSLGAAMGLHLGNNAFGVFLLSSQGSITGLALFISPVDTAETGVQSLMMAGAVLMLLLVWAVTARLLDR